MMKDGAVNEYSLIVNEGKIFVNDAIDFVNENDTICPSILEALCTMN